MARQLDFDSHTRELERSKGTGLSVKRLGSGSKDAARGAVPFLVRWAPVWLPAMLVVQITFFGLLPVLAEQSRLERVESEVAEREEALSIASADTETHRRMLADEIYRERVKKSLARSQEPPLFRKGQGASGRD